MQQYSAIIVNSLYPLMFVYYMWWLSVLPSCYLRWFKITKPWPIWFDDVWCFRLKSRFFQFAKWNLARGYTPMCLKAWKNFIKPWVSAWGMGTRMHYGHPDFVDGFWARNRGGMSPLSIWMILVGIQPPIFRWCCHLGLEVTANMFKLRGKPNKKPSGSPRVGS